MIALLADMEFHSSTNSHRRGPANSFVFSDLELHLWHIYMTHFRKETYEVFENRFVLCVYFGPDRKKTGTFSRGKCFVQAYSEQTFDFILDNLQLFGRIR